MINVCPASTRCPVATETCQTLAVAGQGTADVTADFDFLQTGQQSWKITIETDAGTLLLHDGGARLTINAVEQNVTDSGEYPGLYRHFAALIAAGASECDLAPLELVADAFLVGARREVAAFTF